MIEKTILALSESYNIDVRRHIQDKALDFGTWWEELVSRLSTGEIEGHLKVFPNDGTWLGSMRQTLTEELHRRRTEATS